MFTNFFPDLFTSSNLFDIEVCLEDVPPKVTPMMDEMLLQTFLEDEVKVAMFLMKSMGSQT